MKASVVAALALLTACSGVGASENVHEHSRLAFNAAGVRSVVISNVSGGITLDGGAKQITVDADKRGSGSDDLARTHVVTERRGDELVIRTTYDRSGWFGNSGASVYYTVRIPSGVALDATNVSGDVAVSGMQDDVRASTVSGALHARFARIGGTTNVRLHTISGAMDIGIAKSSDVRIHASTISGDIAEFAGVSITRETVGARADARLGKATASMDLSTVSGGITVSPQ